MEIFARLTALKLSPSRASLVVHLVSQDLSIAGKRAGLAGERSGLFMEMIRVIKEMRDATNGEYPKFAIWENVPGAFSSNGGEDFRAVLEELARVEQPDASIPRPSRGVRWSKAGAIAGNGWSLAWRQLDAQYWGVPQRRKRIALVADFGGQRAAEILFERTGVSGHLDESIKAWETTPGHSQASSSRCDRTGERVVYDARGNGNGRTCPTITGDHENRITDYTAIAVEHAGCLTPWDVQSRRIFSEYGKWPALYSGEGGGHGYVFTLRWIVRRLTPMECERLQGYPDGWTDIGEWVDTKGKKHKPADSPRYKALGNSIALPQWYWIAQKMKPFIGENATLGSLFDGIGGFPLVFESTYGEGTAIWASEVDSFCIAVTKKHFPEY